MLKRQGRRMTIEEEDYKKELEDNRLVVNQIKAIVEATKSDGIDYMGIQERLVVPSGWRKCHTKDIFHTVRVIVSNLEDAGVIDKISHRYYWGGQGDPMGPNYSSEMREVQKELRELNKKFEESNKNFQELLGLLTKLVDSFDLKGKI